MNKDNKPLVHRCDACRKQFATCNASKVFGIDHNPSATNEDADAVIDCDAFEPAKRGA